MNRHLALSVLLFVLSAAPLSQAGQNTFTLDQAFARMDEVSKAFKSVEAAVDRIKVTVIVNDEELKSGRFYYSRRGKEPRVLLEIQKPELQYVLVMNGKLLFYTPKLKQLQEFSTTGHQDSVEMYMALGFGQSSQELRKNYEVSLAPDEVIAGDKRTVLDLKPKGSSPFQMIRLWLDQKAWNAVQIKIVEKSKDYLVMKFSSIKLNAGIPDSRFKLEIPKDARRIP